MSSPFSRTLPSHPDLAQQRKQAKELLESFAAGDAEAQARVRAALPDKQQIALGDAQFVIAREYGFVSWAALKAQIESRVDAARSPIERMHEAIQERNVGAMRRLFERHAELRAQINAPAFAFNAPAIVAFARDAAIVDVLLDFGADPNRRSEWWAGRFHALHHATGAAAERLIAGGAIPDACAAANLDRADLLAQMIADDPARVHERGGDGKTPLHFAQSCTVVDLLLAAGADIDARDVDHRSSPAEYMLDRKRNAGRYELARYLVERGASTDIFLAAALGLRDRVDAMLRVNPALLDLRTGQGPYGEQPPSSYHIYMWTIGSGRSPLDVAAQFEQLDTLRVMMALASPLQRLFVACRLGDIARVRELKREHPRLLDSATEADERAMADAAWNGESTAVAAMLEAGFDPRVSGHDSGTALHCAAWIGSVETVTALLGYRDARALLEIRDARYHATPLGWCCHGSVHGDTSRDHVGIARMLLDAGAVPGPDTSTASPAVESVLAAWRRSARGM